MGVRFISSSLVIANDFCKACEYWVITLRVIEMLILFHSPYSQAIQVGDHVYIAGQIGLVPHTMTLPVCNSKEESASQEAQISFNNLTQVANALNCDIGNHTVLLVCYITDIKYCEIAKHALKGQMVSVYVLFN